MAISTHILDTSIGRPAGSVPVELEKQDESGAFVPVGKGVTNSDGRIAPLPGSEDLQSGIYRIKFDTKAYFSRTETKAFFPDVQITFEVFNGKEHHHVPILLSPFGFSTYRGS